jgi:hypothetical protein
MGFDCSQLRCARQSDAGSGAGVAWDAQAGTSVADCSLLMHWRRNHARAVQRKAAGADREEQRDGISKRRL